MAIWRQDRVGLQKIPGFSRLLEVFFLLWFVFFFPVLNANSRTPILLLDFNVRFNPLKLTVMIILFFLHNLLTNNYIFALMMANYYILHWITLIAEVNVSKELQIYVRQMQDDQRSIKELIMAILQKCKEALPELAVLQNKIDKMAVGQPPKIRKKDCLNPTFLLRLSECGENIRLVLCQILRIDIPKRQTLQMLYNEYMQVIYDIRKYHEQAHKSYDMHKNSTQMKGNLLQELKQQTKKRQQLESKIEILVRQHEKELNDRDMRIQELEERVADREDVNISHISNISRRVGVVSGQFYGGGEVVGKIQENYQYTVQTRRLRKRIFELQQLLEDKEKNHLLELQSQKIQILQLQSKFEELVKTTSIESQSMKTDSFKSIKNDKTKEYNCQHEDIYRLLVVQATTLEEFLRQHDP